MNHESFVLVHLVKQRSMLSVNTFDFLTLTTLSFTRIRNIKKFFKILYILRIMQYLSITVFFLSDHRSIKDILIKFTFYRRS
jgi:hypothetical protein